MTIKRNRANGMANIWNININSEDAIRFLTAVEKKSSIESSQNESCISNIEVTTDSELQLHQTINESTRCRRNAIANIYEF